MPRFAALFGSRLPSAAGTHDFAYVMVSPGAGQCGLHCQCLVLQFDLLGASTSWVESETRVDAAQPAPATSLCLAECMMQGKDSEKTACGGQAAEAAMGGEHSARALARLQAAHDLVARDGGGRQGRLAYHLAALMAREHLIANDAAAARRLLDSVAGAALGFVRFGM